VPQRYSKRTEWSDSIEVRNARPSQPCRGFRVPIWYSQHTFDSSGSTRRLPLRFLRTVDALLLGRSSTYPSLTMHNISNSKNGSAADSTMPSNDANSRKRKPTVFSNGDEQIPKKDRKARKVSATNASASTAASLQVDTPVVTANAITASTASTELESGQSIRVSIRDLFDSDNAIVNAALDSLDLDLDLDEDEEKGKSLIAAGGCACSPYEELPGQVDCQNSGV
jgi:hypothetical protein